MKTQITLKCKPFDLEEAKKEKKAKEIIITKDFCDVKFLNGTRIIECIPKKIKGKDAFNNKSLMGQNPLLAKYYKGRGGWTMNDFCRVESF